MKDKLKPNNSDYLWGYAASFLSLASGLLILPVVLKYLNKDQVGLWFVFMSLASLAQLLDSGFQPTISRNIGYVLGGARALTHGKFNSFAIDSRLPSINLLQKLFDAAKSIYIVLSAICLGSLLLLGSVYVLSLCNNLPEWRHILIAWILFASGVSLNLFSGFTNSFILGYGEIALANQSLVFTRALFVVIAVFICSLGMGIIALGLAQLISALAYQLLLRQRLISLLPHSIYENKKSSSPNRARKILWHNSRKMGFVQIGAFLVQKATILIAASTLGVGDSASYSLSMTVVNIFSSVSQNYASFNTPYLVKIRLLGSGSMEALRARYFRISIRSVALFLLFSVLALIFGPTLSAAIGSSTSLLPTQEFLLLIVIYALEVNHSVAATFIASSNHIPFVLPSIISGVLIVVLSIYLAPQYGVLAMIAVQGIVQLLYNNWKWPLDVLRETSNKKILLSVI